LLVIASCIAVPCIAQLDHLIADPTPDQLDHVELDPSWALKEPGALHELKSVWARKVVLIKAMNQKNARCLDGSPGVYYIRNGIFGGAKKWHIHHQGGGWCSNLGMCSARSKTIFGSSTTYPPRIPLGGGYFSMNSIINPMKHDWNIVLLRYCDGGSFSGSNDTLTWYQGKRLWFRGKHILEAMQDDLLEFHGLRDASDVVISGCSAGGLATYLHVDKWADKLRKESTNPDLHVVGMPDSGWFLDRNSNGYKNKMIQVFALQNASASLDPECLEKYSKKPWKCYFARYAAPLIRTPIFALQGEYDSWQIFNDLGSTKKKKINAYGNAISKTMVKHLINGETQHGMFIDSCQHHCGGWSLFYINGTSQAQAFQDWYVNVTTNKTVNNSRSQQDEKFPCLSCCKRPALSLVV